MFDGLPVSAAYAAAKARGAELRISAPLEPPGDAELDALENALTGLVSPQLVAILRAAGGASFRCSTREAPNSVAEVRLMSPEEIAGRTRELHGFLQRFGEAPAAPSIVIFAQYFGEYYCFSKALGPGMPGRAVFTSDYDSLINYEKVTIRIADDEGQWLSRAFEYYIAGGDDFAYWVPRPPA
jgi:hypothetical protein